MEQKCAFCQKDGNCNVTINAYYDEGTKEFECPYFEVRNINLSQKGCKITTLPFAGACEGKVGWFDGNHINCCGNCTA